MRKADEALAQGKAVEDFCREEQISPATYYRWQRKYGGQIVGGVSGAVATGYEGFKICGPLCAVGGVLLGGTGGAYIGGNIIDPRTMWGNHPPVYYVADAILGFGR